MEQIDLTKVFETESTIQTNCFEKDENANNPWSHLYTESVIMRIYVRLEINSGLSVNWPADYELAHAVLKSPTGGIVERKSIMLSELLASETDYWGNHNHQEILGPIKIEDGAYQLYFEGISILDGKNGKFVSLTTTFVLVGRDKSTDEFYDIATFTLCPSATHRPGRGGRGFPVEKPKL
jgi:hypothetical protein